MKLIKLEILNLASLDNPNGETINFEEGALKDSTIFSIVGPTGSGKSTILDAICLALYNRTPRYPHQKRGRDGKIEIYGEPDKNQRLVTTDCRNILTLGRKNGYSKLTFIANDKQIYRAEWHVRFKQVEYEDSKTNLYRCKQLNDQYIEEKIDWDSIPQIIGLDYEQFLRTVLLAQGSFANFLTANENERYELLEKLVGCEELYTNISKAIKANFDLAKNNYTALESSCKEIEIDLLEDNDLKNLIDEIDRLEKTQQTIQDNLKQIEKDLNWYDIETEKIDTIAKQKKEYEEADIELKKNENDIKQLTLHDSILPAIDLFRSIQKLKDDKNKNREEIELKKNNENSLKTSKQEEEKKLNILKNNELKAINQQNKFSPIIAKARTIKGRITESEKNLNKTKESYRDANNKKDDANKKLNENKKDIEKNKEEITNTYSENETIENEIKLGLEQLNKNKEKIEEKLNIQRDKNKNIDANILQQNKNIADEKLKNINIAKDLSSQYISKNKEKKDNQLEKKQLEDRNITLTNQLGQLTIDELQEQYNTSRDAYTLITSTNWQDHRSKLKHNEPCPLCGATNHPYCDDTTKVTTLSSKLKEQYTSIEQKLKQQKENQKNWQGEKNSNEGKISILQNQLNTIDTELNNINQKWNKLHSEFTEIQNIDIFDIKTIESIIPLFENKQKEIENSLTTYNNTQNEINRLQDQKNQADNNLSEYQQKSTKLLNDAKTKIDKLKEKEIQLTSATPILTNQLQQETDTLETITKELNLQQDNLNSQKQQLKELLQDKDPDTLEDELKTKVKQTQDATKTKENEIQEINNSLKKIEGELDTLQKNLNQNENDIDQKNNQLNDWISNYNSKNSHISIDDISAIYNSNCDWDDIRNKKEILQNKKTSTSTLLTNAQNKYEEHLKTKPQNTKNELLEEHKKLKQQNNNDLLIEAKTRKRKHDDAIEKIGEKKQKLEQTKKDTENWKAINDAIGGDGKTLRKIAQCYTLGFLVEYANAEIRRFNTRFELIHVKNSLGIRVIDHERADDIRETTSLSGGETFIISLGLALGLSSISSRNISLDNLFIDEGFGTLDPESLATVIDSLAMLQSSNGKKVCVISHTDTMSERITTQIRVIKNGNTGSSHIEIHS